LRHASVPCVTPLLLIVTYHLCLHAFVIASSMHRVKSKHTCVNACPVLSSSMKTS
jgi:hypothetical protein